jgi:phenylalanyl-tRNA synthetase beta chain
VRVPLSWLRDFTPVDLPVDELAAVLSDLGLAVESITHVGGGLDGVVVARVTEIGAIEGADKIRRVVVDAGGDPVQVVCGAWNFGAGDLVPLATVGTVLPGEFEIRRRKMKGVESLGMLCAPDELGIPGGDHAGIMVLPEGLEPGTPFADALGIAPDVVFELEVNPNRPDATNIVGVARDLAARLGLPFHVPEPKLAAEEGGQPITLEVDDLAACPRFTVRVIRDVRVGPSPAWLANRLTLAGMRPINNVVDVSNYVMLELGQPNHAYDLGRLGGRGLRVRMARPGETLVTLDDVERRLTADDLLICDAEDRPVGIAGIMGGASSEVGDDTTEVLLEAAYFDPMTIAWTSKRLALRSEASARFERGVDWSAIDRAVARFCELLGATATTSAADVTAPELSAQPPVRVRVARVNDLLGTRMTATQMKGYRDPIGFTARAVGDDELEVTIPPWRPDSAVEIDVIEEIARMHGYTAIEPTVPTSPHTGGLDPVQLDRRRVRHILTGTGASEAWSTTFLAPADLERCRLDASEAVTVTNPLVAEESLLRTSLLPGLVRALAYNASHRQLGVWLWEIGHVFRRPPAGEELPDEREMLAVALAGCEAPEAVKVWRVLAEGLLVASHRLEAGEAPGLHPTRTARVIVDGEALGHVGEVDPSVLEASGVQERVAWLELDLGRLLRLPHGPGQYRPVSRFPSSDLDLSFEVDEAVAAADIQRSLESAPVDVVADVRLLDVYRGSSVGDGRRSLTFRLRLQAHDRTLTDDELAGARTQLIAAVESVHPASLRA